MRKTLLLLFILSYPLVSNAQTVTTFAGGGNGGGVFSEGIGTGTEARFNRPEALCSDANGNMYIADTYNHRIRKITPTGFVSTIAGSVQGYADGQGAAAQFSSPSGICIDPNGNLFVTDYDNQKIRKITPTGIVSTFAGTTKGFLDGNALTSKFSSPYGIFIDPNGNLYISDFANDKIRKISPSGIVSTIAPSENFHLPKGICMDKNGNIYVASSGSDKIKKITPTNNVSDLAGSISGFADGLGAMAMFDSPSGICVDSDGNLFVADALNNRIRKISPAGVVTTFAGNGVRSNYDENGVKVGFYGPLGIHIDADGNINVADTYNHSIRKITPSGWVSTFAGSGSGDSDGLRLVAKFAGPNGLCTDAAGNIYVVDRLNGKIRKITPAGITSTLAGSSDRGNTDGKGSVARFSFPNGVCADANGNIYVTDADNYRIRKITSEGLVSTLAGSTVGILDGPGASAKFSGGINGICADKNGNIYLADEENFKIRKITPEGVVSTFAGSTFGFADGPGNTAKIWQPRGICIDKNGNLYVADRINQRIRKITPSGVVSTFAGSTEGYTDGPGNIAQFSFPEQIGIDSNDNLYVSDYSFGNYLIRKITSSGIVSTVAGSTVGFLDGPVASAQFSGLNGICTDSSGNIYVADNNNGRIRKISQNKDLGLDQDNELKRLVKFYPNPTSGLLNIEVESFNENTQVIITDVLGQRIYSQKIQAVNSILNTNCFAKGIYFISLTNSNEKFTQKIIFQ